MPIRPPDTLEFIRILLIQPNKYGFDGCGVSILMSTLDRAGGNHLIARMFERSSPVTLEFCDNVADEIVAGVFGNSRWWVTRLWANTLSSWSLIEGELTLNGIVDVFALPPHTATSAVFAVWRRRLEQNEKTWQRFLGELEMPPPRAVRREIARQTAEENAAVHAQMQAALASARPRRRVRDSTITLPSGDTLT